MLAVLPSSTPPAEKASDRALLFNVFFFAVFLVLLYQLGRLAQPFLPALMGSAALALAFYPVHVELARRLRLGPQPAAALSTLLVLAIIVVPFALAAAALIREAAALGATVHRVVAGINEFDPQTAVSELPRPLQAGAQSLLDFFDSLDLNIGALLVLGAQRVGAAILDFGAESARHAVFVLGNFALTALSLFYAFRDGASLLRWVLRLIPMPAAHKQAIARRVYDTFQAVVVGSLLVALMQGAVATLGYALAGLRLPWLLGLATTVFAIFPSAFVVLAPAAGYVLSYDVHRGLALVACIAAMPPLEHLVKPALIGSKARLPAILLFFAMFGALRAYGFFGLILGPLLVTAALAFIEIYRTEYFRPTVEQRP